MRKKISVVGEGVKLADELARYADVTSDPRGADVVVLGAGADLEAVRELAPAAVVLVTGAPVEERCRAAYEATLFPRGRIFGVADPSAAAESIVLERGDEHSVFALADGEFAPRLARLGRGGIRELL